MNGNFVIQVDTVLAAAGKEGKESPYYHMFSVNLRVVVEVMARSLLRDPVKVVVAGGVFGGAATVPDLSFLIKQKFMFVGGRGEQGKVLGVHAMLKEGLTPPVLLFV